MHYITILSALTVAWASTKVQAAASTCSGQQYNDIPGFPASNSACYPTNYYRTSDLGNTSPTDAMQRCQSQCTADTSCASVVAQVNKAADSNLYSGTCFFYAKGQTVSPRRCADTAYLLEGYMKDATLNCFSSSSSSASKFCSSYLGIPSVTKTATSTPPVVTTTTSVTTTSTTTATSTSVITPTSTVTTTTTLSTTVATSTLTNTITSSSTTTSTVTSTVTTTTTLGRRKRVVSTVPPPACVSSGTPASRLSAACSCLSVSTGTTTITTTLVPVTNTLTSTNSATSTTTLTVTVTTGTVTTTVTATKISSITATTTSASISTVPVTVTTTTITTSTVTVTPPPTTTPSTTSSAAAGPTTCASYGPIVEGCNNGSQCTIPGTCTVQPSEDVCTDVCLADNNCLAFAYDGNNGDCTIYDDCCPSGSKRRSLRARYPFGQVTHKNLDLDRRDGKLVIVKPGVNIIHAPN